MTEFLRSLDSLRTKLLLTTPVVAESLDRRHAEGEFRIAVSPPLLAIVAIVVAKVEITPLAVLLAAVSIALILCLLTSGLRTLQSADEDLIRLFLDGVISAPVVEEANAQIERRRQEALAFARDTQSN
jgi:hypothetical protein